MREIRQSGSEGGEAEINRPSLPLSPDGYFVFPVPCPPKCSIRPGFRKRP